MEWGGANQSLPGGWRPLWPGNGQAGQQGGGQPSQQGGSQPAHSGNGQLTQAVTHTVTFDGNGGSLSGRGTVTVTVETGKPVAEPPDPLLAGWLFSGWFAPGSTALWDFTRPIDRDITLTARWDLPTLDAIQGRLNRNRSVTVDTVNNEYIIDGSLTVPAGTVLTFRNPVRVAPVGNVTVNGTMNADRGLTNQGTITVNSANTLNVTGALNTTVDGKLAITQSGKVMADTLTGPVEITPGAQMFCKSDKVVLGENILFSQGFQSSDDTKGKWSTTLYAGEYYRLEYSAWKFDETSKTLTIGGVGNMPDYSARENMPPWWKQKKWKTIEKIVIQEGVTSIGADAFYGCSALSSVTIPDSVTSIGIGAFFNCSVLSSITIPDSVTSIGDAAFQDCSSLTSVTIPGSVTSIGALAFGGCSRLMSVTIPGSVTSIGDLAFKDCIGLSSITYTGTMAQWNNITKGNSNTDLTNKTVHCTGDIPGS